MLGFWWLLFAMEFWGLLLVVGYAGLRLLPEPGRFAGSAGWATGAVLAAGCVSLSTATGRADILIEQGVVQSVATLRLYSFTFALIPAILFFAHLLRSRRHEEAVARLAVAQAEQRDAGRRIVHSRLHALQARTEPRLLFELLDAVRRSYSVDPLQAEQLLDELTSFLRAALPRVREPWSSVAREVGLAQHYVRLRCLASQVLAAGTVGSEALAANVSDAALHARFPPGVLLPLLDDVLRAAPGACRLAASRAADDCLLVLALPAWPAGAVVARVRELLAEVHGNAAALLLEAAGTKVVATVRVPYEFA
jgi:hypothetical protein